MSKREPQPTCPRCGQALLRSYVSDVDWDSLPPEDAAAALRSNFDVELEEHTCTEDYESFHGAEFGPGGNLEGANLYRAVLNQRNFRNTNLRNANLEGASLYEANLEGACLERANLEGALLQGANLRSANLAGADLVAANLLKAKLAGANLEGAITSVRRRPWPWPRRSLDGRYVGRITIWPEGFDPVAAGVIFVDTE